jgi:hypothetical protein
VYRGDGKQLILDLTERLDDPSEIDTTCLSGETVHRERTAGFRRLFRDKILTSSVVTGSRFSFISAASFFVFGAA